MTKKTICLISFMLLLFAYACKKELYVKDNQEQAITEVSQWFNARTSHSALNTSIFRKSTPKKGTGTSTSAIPTSADHQLNADWTNAKTYETVGKTIIEVPLLHDGIFMFNFKPMAKGDSVSKSKSITRLLFFKTAEKTEGYFRFMSEGNG
ncbi:MAG: hypothetical protein V4541_00215 [Bacteroidota bacterium]